MTDSNDDLDSFANGGSYTVNSRAPKGDPSYENPGVITSDSLAAESLSSPTGTFASNNPRNVAASGVPSKSTTANTTDISGAATLPAASNSASRNGGDRIQAYATPADQGYTDGSAQGVYGTTSSSTQESYGGDAPSMYSSAGGTEENLKPRPRGKNLKEGGFDGEAPNASFNGDVGGKNDVGRVAEAKFVTGNASSGADAGYEGASREKEGARSYGEFENLEREEGA